MMEVKVNGKPVRTEASDLTELAAQLGLPDKGIAVAVAGRMVPRAEWKGYTLEEGASIIVIRATCGG